MEVFFGKELAGETKKRKTNFKMMQRKDRKRGRKKKRRKALEGCFHTGETASEDEMEIGFSGILVCLPERNLWKVLPKVNCRI